MTDKGSPEHVEKPRRRMSRWVWGVLIVSVAFNLLIVGSFVGLHLAGHGHHGHGMRGLIWKLPKDQRDEVRGILKKHREGVRPLRRELRASRDDLIAYLKQDKIELSELERRLDELEVHRQKIRSKLRPMVLELAEKLEPEDRARVLRRFLGKRRGGKWRHRRHD